MPLLFFYMRQEDESENHVSLMNMETEILPQHTDVEAGGGGKSGYGKFKNMPESTSKISNHQFTSHILYLIF